MNLGRFLGEAFVLESSETAGKGQVRGTVVLVVLPPEQLHPDADVAEGEKLESERHQWKIR